jgi:peptidoglycan/LPS O-acetylase OafA/YrhL
MLNDVAISECQYGDQPQEPRSNSGRLSDSLLPYVAGIDGLRALAVIAVLLFHADVSWATGGFLGVEIFFVISGFLITSLLLSEWRTCKSVDLGAFWLRRARRLLPASLLVIIATLVYAVVFLPGKVASWRGDALAAVGQVINWYLIFADRPYFEIVGRPPPLQHFWSLAIEAQLYLLWPPLFLLLMWRVKERSVLLLVITGVAASGLVMAGLYHSNLDPARVYYGTDTRAGGFLVGVALAFVQSASWLQHRVGRWKSLLIDGIGVVAVGALIFCIVRLDEYQSLRYQGGLLLVALLTAVAIAALVSPGARAFPALLAPPPLHWIGLRSYSIYLWHWPVFVVTRPQLDLSLDGWQSLALRFGVTLALAELSYRCVETPFRRGAFERAWRALLEARGAQRRRLSVWWAGAFGSVAAGLVALVVVVAPAQPQEPPDYLAVEAVRRISRPSSVPVTPAPQPTKTRVALVATVPSSPTPRATATPQPTLTPTPVPEPRVTAIGDSVMVGAADELEEKIGELQIDAKVGRQTKAAIAILRDMRAAGQLGDVVVVHIGNNSPFKTNQLDELMDVLKDVRNVVIVNLKVPRRWEEPNNALLADLVQRYPNTTLVDWHATGSAHPELFRGDGIHLRPSGAEKYAELIVEQLNQEPRTEN